MCITRYNYVLNTFTTHAQHRPTMYTITYITVWIKCIHTINDTNIFKITVWYRRLRMPLRFEPISEIVHEREVPLKQETIGNPNVRRNPAERVVHQPDCSEAGSKLPSHSHKPCPHFWRGTPEIRTGLVGIRPLRRRCRRRPETVSETPDQIACPFLKHEPTFCAQCLSSASVSDTDAYECRRVSIDAWGWIRSLTTAHQGGHFEPASWLRLSAHIPHWLFEYDKLSACILFRLLTQNRSLEIVAFIQHHG